VQQKLHIIELFGHAAGAHLTTTDLANSLKWTLTCTLCYGQTILSVHTAWWLQCPCIGKYLCGWFK